MALTLTSCVRVHEPGFSKSECLELARRIEQFGKIPDSYDIECDRNFCNGTIIECDDGMSYREVNAIAAALRAFAE